MRSYAKAVDRAVLAMSRSMRDPRRDAAASVSLVEALRAYVGDPSATAFPVDAVKCVQRHVLARFGDTFGKLLCENVERAEGAEAAEVVDRELTEAIAQMFRQLGLSGEVGE